MPKFSVRVGSELAARVDELVENGEYYSRSQALREGIEAVVEGDV